MEINGVMKDSKLCELWSIPYYGVMAGFMPSAV